MLFSQWLYYFEFCYISFSQIILDQFEAFKSHSRLCYDSSRKPLFCFFFFLLHCYGNITLKNLTNTSFSRGTRVPGLLWIPGSPTLAKLLWVLVKYGLLLNSGSVFGLEWFHLRQVWRLVFSQFPILDLCLCNSLFSGIVTWKF